MAANSQGLLSLGEVYATSGPPEHKRLRILLVDDKTSAIDTFGGALRSAGYSLCHAHTGTDALLRCRSDRPHLILLYPSLPDVDGKEVIRQLRKWTSTPIFVISAVDEESEIIACLDLGADYYVKKPLAPGELLARVRAALRKTFGTAEDEVFTAGDLRVDFNRREVFVGQHHVRLTATEYQLLRVLVRHAGVVRTHYQLIHEVWGTTQYQDAVHLLRVTVSNLRRKVASDSTQPLPIVTEPGVGYRLRSDSSCASSARPN
jgi:two-component system KDP operon response regulator KdpE